MHDLKLYRFWLAALFIMLGSMSKEVAFFCFSGIDSLSLDLQVAANAIRQSLMTWSWRLKAIAPLVLGGLSYFFMRTASFKHVDKGISKVVDAEAYQFPFNVAKQVITDFGFYIKKLLIPQPLSLAIDQVNPGYFWLGLVATYTDSAIWCL